MKRTGERDKQNKIRVLMCCSDLETVKGGMVTVVKNYLTYSGWKGIVFSFIPTHRDGSKLVKSMYFAWAALRVTGAVFRKEVDLVHLHTAERGSFYRKSYLLRICKMFRVPVILHHHAAEFEEFYAGLGSRQKRYVGNILEQADMNLVLSEFSKINLLKKAPNAKVTVLHNAVVTERAYDYQGTRPKIVMVGRQGERKGSYDLLDAMVRIKDKMPKETQLWLCGDGETSQVAARAEELGLSDMISHIGWLKREELDKCLTDAAIHVLPSKREELPMSILETMSRGIPNISTRIASIPEVIINDETGILLEPGDVEKLAQALLGLWQDREKRLRLSRAGYHLVMSEFSMDGCVNKLEGIYEKICANRIGEKQEA